MFTVLVLFAIEAHGFFFFLVGILKSMLSGQTCAFQLWVWTCIRGAWELHSEVVCSTPSFGSVPFCFFHPCPVLVSCVCILFWDCLHSKPMGDFEVDVVIADVPISPVEPELHSRWL